MFVGVGGCWWVLVGVGGCWWVLVGIGGCWLVLVGVPGCVGGFWLPKRKNAPSSPNSLIGNNYNNK